MRLFCFAVLFPGAATAASAADAKAYVGTWEGESLCTVHPSACHDEHVIYDVTAAGEKLNMSADKVVDGKRINMGSLPCAVEAGALRCPFRDTVWSFTAKDKVMEGELRLGDGTLFRRVKVEKK